MFIPRRGSFFQFKQQQEIYPDICLFACLFLAFAFEVWKPFQEVCGRVGSASSVSSTEPFFPFLSLRKDLTTKIKLNHLGFIKKTTNCIINIMNLIFKCSVYVIILPES